MARRFRRWPGALTTLLVIAIVAAVIRAWLVSGNGHEGAGVVSSTSGGRVVLQSGPCEILAAEDGNTLLIQQGEQRFRVRLLGVAVPQVSGDEVAKDELLRIARAGPASIELDKRRAAADGSWLAYVYVDETLVNAELLASGSATYEVYPGDSFPVGRELKAAQDAARRARRGIWQSAE